MTTDERDFSVIYANKTQNELIWALYDASKQGDINLVRYLLDNGVDVNACIYSRNASQRYPLRVSVLGGHRDVTQLLLERGALITKFTFVSDFFEFTGVSGWKCPWDLVYIEMMLRKVLLLQRAKEYARIPRELFGELFTYLK